MVAYMRWHISYFIEILQLYLSIPRHSKFLEFIDFATSKQSLFYSVSSQQYTFSIYLCYFFVRYRLLAATCVNACGYNCSRPWTGARDVWSTAKSFSTAPTAHAVDLYVLQMHSAYFWRLPDLYQPHHIVPNTRVALFYKAFEAVF